MGSGSGTEDLRAEVTRLRAQLERAESLAHGEQTLRSVIEALDGAIAIVGGDGVILDVNGHWMRDAVHRALGRPGRPRPGTVGTSFFSWCEAVPGMQDLLSKASELVREVLAGSDRGRAEAPGELSLKGRAHLDDRERWIVVRVHPIRDHATARAVVSVLDITEGMRTQERLQESMRRAEGLAAALSRETTLLTGVLSAIPHLVFWKDDTGRYLGCNAAFRVFRGLEDDELLGRTETDLALCDDLGAALVELEAEVAASGQPLVDQRRNLHDSTGALRSLLLSVLPLDPGTPTGQGVIGVGADITHASELERQLAQTNRLESIGQLAAGIAHELNTPVQYVADNLRFIADAATELLRAAQQLSTMVSAGQVTVTDDLRDRAADLLSHLDLEFLGTELPEAVGESAEGLGRVTEIVRAMKEYAHPGTGRAEVDVNRAIESTVQVCRNEWKYVARIDLDLDASVGGVPLYEGDFKQVVLNIVVNAAQAIAETMPGRREGDLGTISIRTRRAGDELLVTITDDGPGMDETVRRRAFDPFFTTKTVGRGTGQGLSLVHSVIVTKHQGRIELESSPGAGARFTLHLPLNPREQAG